MKKLLMLLFATMLALGPANAADLYTTPAGTGTTCSVGSPCALSTANQKVMPGDRVYVGAGTHSAPVAPSRAGTEGSRITYIGADLANPSLSTVGGIGIGWAPAHDAGNDYITVKGVRTRGELGLGPNGTNDRCVGDSLINIDAEQFCGFRAVDPTTVFKNSTFGDSTAGALVFTNPGEAPNYGGEFDNCVFNVAGDSPDGNYPIEFHGWNNLYMHDSNINIIQLSTSHDIGLLGLGGKFWRFYDNKITFRNEKNGTQQRAYFRDFWADNLMLRDTVEVDTTGGAVSFWLSGAGSNSGSVTNNTWRSCVFKLLNRPLTAQNGWVGTRLDSCTIITSSPTDPGLGLGAVGAVHLGTTFQGTPIGWGTNSQITHCIIQNKTGPAVTGNAIDGVGQNIIENNTFYGRPASGQGVVEFAPTFWTTGVIFKDNFIYGGAATTGAHALKVVYPTTASTQYLDSDYNLMATWNKTTTNGDMAVSYKFPSVAAVVSNIGPGTAWSLATANDDSSRAIGPWTAESQIRGPAALTDSTASGFHFVRVNAKPLVSSAGARGASGGLNESFGAVQSDTAAAAPDLIRPAPITDLTVDFVGRQGLVVSFTNVGDDSLTGTAHHYDVRMLRSNSTTTLQNQFDDEDGTCYPDCEWSDLNISMGLPLTAEEQEQDRWDRFTNLVPIGPTPGAPGTRTSLLLTQHYSADGTTGYYESDFTDVNRKYVGVWVAAVDEANRRSAVKQRGVVFEAGLFPPGPDRPFGTPSDFGLE